jgi:hypothetical protein
VIAVTKNCGKYGHPEFSLSCEDTPIHPQQMRWLITWVEQEVSQGKKFLPGQTVQIGWSVLKVDLRADGTLALFEPDFKSMPMKFVDRVSTTLWHVLMQKLVTDSLGVENEINESSLQRSAIVCSDFGKGKGLFMERSIPSGHASGWFFGCADAAHDHHTKENLRLVSLYEAAVLLDGGVTPYLGLPPGISISFAAPIPRFFREKKELFLKPNSYLDTKFRQQKTDESTEIN